MRLLKVDKVEPLGTVFVLWGIVENEQIIVGQDVVFVSASGKSDPGYLTGIMPNYEGVKEFDVGSVGKAVKVVYRRKTPSFPDKEIVALEKKPQP